jgi:hypothetical protein
MRLQGELTMRAALFALVLIVAGATPAFAQNNPLIGVWQAQVNDQNGGPQQVTVVIQANGTYSEQWRGANNLLTNTGRWFVVQGDIVRFEIVDWQPRQWCGPLGCNDLQQPPNSLVRVQFRGPNVLVAIPVQGGGGIVYQRVG